MCQSGRSLGGEFEGDASFCYFFFVKIGTSGFAKLFLVFISIERASNG